MLSQVNTIYKPKIASIIVSKSPWLAAMVIAEVVVARGKGVEVWEVFSTPFSGKNNE